MRKYWKITLKTATCSEASILEYIYTRIIPKITHIKEGKEEPVKILGTILQVSSLKDPCSQNCIPMFEAYLNQIHTELSRRLSDVDGIFLAPQLENTILISGRQKHIYSRIDYNEDDAPILVNFESPSHAIYSKKMME